MKCFICGRDEKYFENKFKPVLESFKNQLDVVNTELENIKENYAKENGFTEENYFLVQTINENILEMKIKSTMENKETFLKMESKLKLLYNYLEKYRPQISLENSISDLIALFVLEPTENRYDDILKKQQFRKYELEMGIQSIESKLSYFFEVSFPFDAYEFQNADNNILLNKTISKYYEKQEEIIRDKKILLCPCCTYLFDKASSASYNVIHAHDNDYDDDWGDEDDYY
ncbi:hypothetical protein FACS1894172_21700 [Spirochaetia bacterium]|nr:hypothetical protein FACS1894172_21700 [Spirochaetia bacterium]